MQEILRSLYENGYVDGFLLVRNVDTYPKVISWHSTIQKCVDAMPNTKIPYAELDVVSVACGRLMSWVI